MKPLNRRDFLTLSGSSLIGLTLGGVTLSANGQSLPKLPLDDAAAKQLGYAHASNVAGEACAKCMYVLGAADAQWRPCATFPGYVVNAKGRCSAFVQKP